MSKYKQRLLELADKINDELADNFHQFLPYLKYEGNETVDELIMLINKLEEVEDE